MRRRRGHGLRGECLAKVFRQQRSYVLTAIEVMDAEVAPMEAWFQEALLYAPGMRIAGGSDEILRNIIAERVLGMPGDIRVDKDVPFRELKTGKR